MKPQSWQILSSKVVHRTPWIEVVEDLCDANGQQLTYTYTRRVDEGPLIIAEEDDGSLWLVQQYRHPIKKVVWQFPVEGKLLNESWEASAARGLQEELQLKADKWEDLGEFYPDPGGLEQKYRAYVASGLHAVDSGDAFHLENEVEELQAKRFTLNEIHELISRGEICDNWTLAALFLFYRHKQLKVSYE